MNAHVITLDPAGERYLGFAAAATAAGLTGAIFPAVDASAIQTNDPLALQTAGWLTASTSNSRSFGLGAITGMIRLASIDRTGAHAEDLRKFRLSDIDGRRFGRGHASSVLSTRQLNWLCSSH